MLAEGPKGSGRLWTHARLKIMLVDVDAARREHHQKQVVEYLLLHHLRCQRSRQGECANARGGFGRRRRLGAICRRERDGRHKRRDEAANLAALRIGIWYLDVFEDSGPSASWCVTRPTRGVPAEASHLDCKFPGGGETKFTRFCSRGGESEQIRRRRNLSAAGRENSPPLSIIAHLHPPSPTVVPSPSHHHAFTISSRHDCHIVVTWPIAPPSRCHHNLVPRALSSVTCPRAPMSIRRMPSWASERCRRDSSSPSRRRRNGNAWRRGGACLVINGVPSAICDDSQNTTVASWQDHSPEQDCARAHLRSHVAAMPKAREGSHATHWKPNKRCTLCSSWHLCGLCCE